MSVANVTTARIDTADTLAATAGPWSRLVGGVPFRSHEWLSAWWKHYQRVDRELYLVTVQGSNSELLGLLPLYREHSATRGRVLRLLGSGEVCSDYLTVLTTGQNEDTVIDAIANHLLNASSRDGGEHDRWDLLELEGVGSNDSRLAKLVAALCESGCGVHRKPGMNCWNATLPASWDELYHGLSKNRRKALRRLQRENIDSGKAKFHIATNDGEFEAAMTAFVDLHQKRRISLGERGCFASKPFANFIDDVSQRLWSTGQLELAWIEIENHMVAIEYNLLGGDTVYSFQGGLDPDFLEASPGTLLTLLSIRHSIERGRKTYDFLRGDEPYKSHWCVETHPTVTLRIAANHASAHLRQGVWLAGATMKNWVKGGFTLTGMQ